MEDLKILYKKLEQYKNFDECDNCEKFLDAVDQIILQKNPESIPILLSYFDDESDYSWVFESMSGAIEHYNLNIFVKEVLKNISILMKKAPVWADNIVNGIFNHEKYRELFIANMHLASKEDLLKLFDVMEVESPHHKGLIQELRKKITV